MKEKSFSWAPLLVVILTVSLGTCVLGLPESPNFVILFADDLGYGDLSSFGHPTIQTPNLDRMVSEGKRLTQWYSAWSVCSPSRAALLTGRIPLRSGMGAVLPADAVGGIPPDEILLPELLKQKGYTTGMVGKWHLGQQPQYLPLQHGFDYYYGVPYSSDMGAQPGYPCPVNVTWCQTNLPLLINNTIVQQPVSLEGLEMDYAVQATQFIQQNKDNPFFLYMAHNHAHTAVQGQWCSAPFYNTSERGLYGDAVQELDWVAGQILNTIRSLELEQNTLVVFTSDNGPWLVMGENGGSAGLFYGGKGSTWEGGIRMPAIAWWPGVIAPATITNQLVNTMDLFTTILSLAGIDVPKDRVIDGRNVTDTLLYGGTSPHDFMFFWNGKPGNYTLCAVRGGNYKAHYVTGSLFAWENYTIQDPPLIFDVNMDPSERYPLNSTSAQYNDALTSLTIAFAQHVKEMVFGIDQVSRGYNITLAICCDWATNCTCGQNFTKTDFERERQYAIFDSGHEFP